MLYVLDTGICMLYSIAEWYNPHTAIYTENKMSNYNVALYVHNLFKGVLTDSRYKETI